MDILTKMRRFAGQTASEDDILKNWRDYRWQLRHAVRDLKTFEGLTGIKLSGEEKTSYQKVLEKFPLSITPYYFSLIDFDDYQNDPIFIQAFPSPRELNITRYDLKDPLLEEKDSPVPLITHRYPDRVLFLVSNMCAM